MKVVFFFLEIDDDYTHFQFSKTHLLNLGN